MAVLSDYTSGTITLANGSTNVTGTGTLFDVAKFREGDTLQIQNLTAIIASVDSNTQLTLIEPWTGADLIDAPYRARYLPDGARVTAQTTTLIELLGNGVLSNIAELPVEDGKLIIGNAAGQYVPISKDELGIQDPNGSLGKLAGLTLIGNRLLTTDANGDISLSANAGEVVMLPGSTIPSDRRLLKLNGSTISRTSYNDLFQYAGDSGSLAAQGSKTPAQFGTGDGSSTFTLPDWRGYFIRAWDDGRGIDVGRLMSAIQAAAMQNHHHELPFGFDGNVTWPAIFDSTTTEPAFGSSIRSVNRTQGSHASGAAISTSRVAWSSQEIIDGGETRPINLAALFAIRY
ncbi:tail fiber protein [Ochrobactrum sp. CM-21-5]|nr:phage tail protein [Ochrobactrum sp. CM-21-5]MBC2887322.1 tail fiber protein [Ochrobactrum sp. CM-21-5]